MDGLVITDEVKVGQRIAEQALSHGIIKFVGCPWCQGPVQTPSSILAKSCDRLITQWASGACPDGCRQRKALSESVVDVEKRGNHMTANLATGTDDLLDDLAVNAITEAVLEMGRGRFRRRGPAGVCTVPL